MEPHSAWSTSSREESADGWACVENAIELGMGAPTIGRLRTSSGFERDCVSPSIRASADGRLLAYAEWRSGRNPRSGDRGFHVRVYDLRDRREILQSGPYGVVELESLDAEGLVLIDGPGHNPTRVTIEFDRD